MSTERSVSRRGFLQVTASAAGVAGASGTAVAAEEEQDEQNGGEGTTHTVEMTDGLVFDPDSLTVAPGDTVVWENVGDQGHSVTAYEDSIPDAAEYWASGGFDSEQAARDAYSPSGGIEDAGNVPGGESWSRTFDTEGTHEYFCIPHEGAGMVGEIEVDPDAGSDGGSGGGGAPAIPDGAKAIGVATTVAMVTTLGLAFTLLKYGGGPAEE
jgi:plastocyanin